MADQSVTHRIKAEYGEAVQGYKLVKQELAATERANKQAAATAKAAAKEASEAERARSNYLRELERQSTSSVKKFIQDRKAAAIAAEKEKAATLRRIDQDSTNAAKRFIQERRDAQLRASDEFVRMRQGAEDRIWSQQRAAMWRQQRAAEDAATKTKEGGGAFDFLTEKVGDFKGALLGIVAGYASFEGLIRLAETYYGKLDRIAGKQAQMGEGLRELAAKSGDAPGATSVDLKRTAEQGKRLGVKPEEMASTRAWARDITGEKGDFDLKAAVLAEQQTKLEKIGFEKGSTQDAMGSLVRQGKGPQEAARLLYASTSAGALSQESLPKIATSLERYKSTEEGLAVASAFKRTGKYSDKEVASATASVGEAFETSDMAKRLRAKYKAAGIDYDSANIAGKIEDVRALYGDDEKNLVKRGLSEEQAKNIKVLMGGGVAREQAAMAGVSKSAIDDKLEILKATPELQPMFGAQEQAAKAGYAAMYGPQAQTARDTDKMAADAGSYYMKSNAPGAAWMYDENSGQANTVGRGIYSYARGSARAYKAATESPLDAALLPFNAARFTYEESIGKSPMKSLGSGGADAGAGQGDPELRDNTAATRELTQAIRGAKGGGRESDLVGSAPIDRNADV